MSQQPPMLWQRPPDDLALGPDEVHVWRVDCDPAPDVVRLLRQRLSPDEVARSERFRFPEHRDRFVVCRGALRSILGRYLSMAPSAIQFQYGTHGKPLLADGHQAMDLQFNVTHSHRLALLAVTIGRPIGIDIEYAGRSVDADAIGRQFFSPREAATLQELPESLRSDAFFACWTRKEAYVKAKGGGLSIPLDAFSVSLAPGEPAALLRTAWDPTEAAQWCLRDLTVDSGYRAALAVLGHDWQIQRWNWQAE